MLIEYLQYLYEHKEEFQKYIGVKLFGKIENTNEPKKYVFFNKQIFDYYLNICSDVNKFNNVYCKNIGKHDLVHVSFHVGIKNRPFQIHVKCGKSKFLVIDLKTEDNNFVFSVNANSNKKVYDTIIREFLSHHNKKISTENIISIIDGLFNDYQINKNINGGNSCYCIKCVNIDNHVIVDFNNIFFANFMNVVLEYITILLNMSEAEQQINSNEIAAVIGNSQNIVLIINHLIQLL